MIATAAINWFSDLGEGTGAFQVIDHQADRDFGWRVMIRLEGGTVVPLRLQGRKRITPRELLGFAQHVNQTSPGETIVLCSERVSPRVAAMCSSLNLGYLDTFGNCHLKCPGLYLHIEGHKPEPALARRAADLFAPRSSRVSRLLLSDPKRGWRVQELAKEAQISLGLASRVKQGLLDEAYVEFREGRTYVRSPRELLNAWKQHYKAPQSRLFYVMESAVEIEEKIEVWAQTCSRPYGLTGLSGARRVAPMVRQNLVVAYVDLSSRAETEEFTFAVKAKAVDSGANLVIWQPADDYVFHGARRFGGTTVVSSLQLYLDLSVVPGRGEEAAEEILHRELEPLWQA